jgi:TPR repeat protein
VKRLFLATALALCAVPALAQNDASLEQLEQAAENGDRNAQTALAERFLKGDETLQNHARAAEWFTRAAENGDPQAQNKLGQLYQTGLGVPQDTKTALRWLEEAAKAGDPQHLHDLASVLETPEGGSDIARAAALYTRAAATGHLPATVSLGVLYQNGIGVAQDLMEARRLYEIGAQAGLPRALNNLGLLYVRGDGVAQDHAQAASLFAAAAERGLHTAMTNLGVMYENGFGVPQDKARAIALYRLGGSGLDANNAEPTFVYDTRLAPPGSTQDARADLQKAAKAQDPVALFQLGWLLATQPDPAFEDMQRAASLFRAAADRGHGPAMANLSLMYFKGLGVPQDFMLGQMWLILAKRAGIPTESLSIRFATRLTPGQINEAQRRATTIVSGAEPKLANRP